MLGNFGIAQNYKFLADVFDICMSQDKSIKLVLIFKAKRQRILYKYTE